MAAHLGRQPLADRAGATTRCWRQRTSRRPPCLLPRSASQRSGCRAQLQPTPPSPGAAAAAAGVTTASPVPATALPPAGHAGGGGGGDPAPPPLKDEPELALLLIACGIGLATGACIVGFNVAVHAIRDAVWQEQELLTSNAAARLREITETDLWPKVVFPPLLAGLAVGGLGWAIGGYEDRPPPRLGPAAGSTQQQQQQQAGAAGAATSSAWELWKLKAAAVVRPVSRAVAAAITLGSGASLGPEGPSVDIGKSVAQGLGSSLRSRQRHLTALIAAGSGAGVAAGFNAPISGGCLWGVFFAVETVLQRTRRDPAEGGSPQAQQQQQALTIAMVLLASVLAAIVSQSGLGSSPAFRVPEYRLEALYELPLYLVFGAVCGLVSASCSFSTKVATEAFDELREQNSFEAALTPAMGGLTTGILALSYPEILYQGFDNVNNILSSNGSYAPGLLLQIVVLKVIATAICRGSGLQGGLYAPSIFIGASLGTAYGLVAHAVGDPLGLALSAPQAYALVGVAALLASNCAVPLTSVLLLFELTRDYLIILPTLAAVGISFWVSSLAAPTVKRAARARRVVAAAAVQAAVGTTKLSRADGGERALVGSLQDKLAAVPTAAAASAAAAAAPPSPAGQTEADGPARLAAAAARGGASLSVACALEQSCLLVEADMPVERALALMEADGQHVAVVLAADGGVMGLVTREILEQCVEAAEEAGSDSAVSDSGTDGTDGGAGARQRRRRRRALVAAEAEGGSGTAPAAASAALSSRGEE